RLSDPSGVVAADSSGNARPGEYLVSPTLGATGALVNDTDPGIGVTVQGGLIPHSNGMVRYRTGAGLPSGNSARTMETWINTTTDAHGVIVGNDVWTTFHGWNHFIGNLDDVAIYPTALSAAQVQDHFAASGNTRPGAPTSLTASAGANQVSVSWAAPATGTP